jgi:phosphatidate phosphatase APP1
VRQRPFLAARVEKQFNRRLGASLRRLGWSDTIIGYTGYGSTSRLRVLGRVVLTRHGRQDQVPSTREDSWAGRRGWRNFVNLPAVNRPVTVEAGGCTSNAMTDRDGYIDVTISQHHLSPGWHLVRIISHDATVTQAPVLIIGDDTDFGIISDIDDTIITSYLPRMMIAAYNTFVLTESARTAVPGMAALYRRILRNHDRAPIFYLSTGSWGTQPFLERFLGRHGYPAGPMLLTDWGPTNSGWFRSGPDHKRISLINLARDFPNIRWLLIGDDGQHDPAIYGEFAKNYPDNVVAIAIRELPMVEQILAHGSPGQLDQSVAVARPLKRQSARRSGRTKAIASRPSPSSSQTPMVAGADGFALNPLLADLLHQDG